MRFMDKKKILIVSFSFFPRISPRSFRATELAKELAKEGHDVTVLTHKNKNCYQEFQGKYNLKIDDFVKGRWREIQRTNKLFKIIRFILNYLFLFPDIQLTSFLKKELNNYSGFNLLISIAVPYPVHWGVALAKKQNSELCKTWVADCGDPFMGNEESMFKRPFYLHCVENWFCKKPDYITVPIEEAIKAYPAFCRKKIRVIPQGFDFEESKNQKSKPNNPVPTFAYAGGLSKGFRDPRDFLEYLCTKNTPFKFIIYTQRADIIKPYENRLGGKIEIKDYIPREQLLQELAIMDFLVNFENKHNVQSPSKLIDYALTNRPIISIKSSDLNRTVVDEFLIGDYSNQMRITDMDKYDIKNVVSQFFNLTQ